MSVEERLRSAFADQADAFAPDVGAALTSVHERGDLRRRRRTVLGLSGVAAAAATIAGLVVALQLPSQRDTRVADPTPTSTSSSPGTRPLRGWISGVVAHPGGLAGSWAMELKGNATMTVRAPAGLEDAASGALYTADAANFRTTLFAAGACDGDGTGIYRWRAVDGLVEFSAVSEPCAARAEFFTRNTWRLSTGSGSRG